MRKALQVNLLALLWGLWRRRYIIVLPIILLPILGLAVGLLSPKKYETSTTILIQEAARHNPFLEDLAVATKLKERMDALTALLHSRHILGPVALKIGLVNKDMPGEEVARQIATLSKSLSVDLVGDDLVKLKHTGRSPENMAETLRLISIRFVEKIIAPERSSIASSENFLKQELEKRRLDLAAAEEKAAKYKSRHAGELPELHTNNVVRLGRLQESLAQKKSSLEGAEAALLELEQKLVQTNPVIGRIEEGIVQTLGELAELRARYTNSHSKVRAALQRLQSLEQERTKLLRSASPLEGKELERLWNMAWTSAVGPEATTQPLLISQLERFQEAKDKARGLAEEVATIQNEVDLLRVKVESFGEHDRRLTEFQRDIDIKRRIYEDLAERHQLARVTGALGKAEESERVKLIDPPFTPLAPTNMPVPLFVIAGVIGGMALGTGIAVILEVLDTRLYRQDVVRTITGIPVLTRIPDIKIPHIDPNIQQFFEEQLTAATNGERHHA